MDSSGAARGALPPTSPLAEFPSPFAETRIAAVRELLSRTHSSKVTSFESTVDRVGRNYTPTAQGLTMRHLTDRLRDPLLKPGEVGSSGASAALSPPSKRGGGPALVIGSGAVTTAGGSGAGAAAAGRGPVLTSFPRPVAVMTLRPSGARSPTRGAMGASASGPLLPLFAPPLTMPGSPTGVPASPLSSSTSGKGGAPVSPAAIETAIRARYAFRGPFSESQEEAEQAQVAAYWTVVDGVVGDADLPEHPAHWEDAVIARLAASLQPAAAAGGSGTATHSSASAAGGKAGVAASSSSSSSSSHGGSGGPPMTWRQREAAATAIPPLLLQRYGPAFFVPPPPRTPPVTAVEAMFRETVRVYLTALRRAIVDYHLKSTTAGEHHGLNLHIVDSLRYIHPPPETRTSTGISCLAAPVAGLMLSRKLHGTEPFLRQLVAAWYEPRQHAAALVTAALKGTPPPTATDAAALAGGLPTRDAGNATFLSPLMPKKRSPLAALFSPGGAGGGGGGAAASAAAFATATASDDPTADFAGGDGGDGHAGGDAGFGGGGLGSGVARRGTTGVTPAAAAAAAIAASVTPAALAAAGYHLGDASGAMLQPAEGINGNRAVAGSYGSAPLTAFASGDFSRLMPLSIDELGMVTDGQAERVVSLLKGHWHREAGELVAAFVLRVEDMRRTPMGHLSPGAGGATSAADAFSLALDAAAGGGPGVDVGTPGAAASGPTFIANITPGMSASAVAAAMAAQRAALKHETARLIETDPLVRDFIRYAVAIVRGRAWETGRARGQERARYDLYTGDESPTYAGSGSPTGDAFMGVTGSPGGGSLGVSGFGHRSTPARAQLLPPLSPSLTSSAGGRATGVGASVSPAPYRGVVEDVSVYGMAVPAAALATEDEEEEGLIHAPMPAASKRRVHYGGDPASPTAATLAAAAAARAQQVQSESTVALSAMARGAGADQLLHAFAREQPYTSLGSGAAAASPVTSAPAMNLKGASSAVKAMAASAPFLLTAATTPAATAAAGATGPSSSLSPTKAAARSGGAGGIPVPPNAAQMVLHALAASAAERRALPPLDTLLALSPTAELEGMHEYFARLLLLAQPRDAVIARRIRGGFQAAASVMSACLRQVAEAGLRDFRRMLETYALPAIAVDAASGLATSTYRPVMIGRPTGTTSSSTGSGSAPQLTVGSPPLRSAELAATETTLSPLLRLALGLQFGVGSASLQPPPPPARIGIPGAPGGDASDGSNTPLDQDSRPSSRAAPPPPQRGGATPQAPGRPSSTHSLHAAAAAAGGAAARPDSKTRRRGTGASVPHADRPGSGGAAGAASAGAAGDAPGTGRELTPAQVAAQAALEEAGADQIAPPAPTPAEELSKLWAGSISFRFEPNWDQVEASLMHVVDTIVGSFTSFPRVESEMAAASGVAAVASAASKISSAVHGGDSTALTTFTSPAGGGKLASLGVMANSLLDVMAAQGNIPVLQPDEHCVQEVRTLVHRVVALNRSVPDALLARFNAFAYVFGPEEKARLISFVKNPSHTPSDYRAELQQMDDVIRRIDAVCDNLIVLPLITISAAPLKDALKARVRLLATLVMRHVKLQTVYACEHMNVQYARLSAKLLFKPSSSEELVALHEFHHGVESSLKSLERAMHSTTGIAQWVRLLYSEALSREYQRHYAGGITAAGPSVLSDEPAPVPAGGRRASFSNQNAMAEMDGVTFTRAQTGILKEALAWPGRIRQDMAVCEGVLDAEKAALVDKLAFRVSEYQKELTETRHLLDKLCSEGGMNRIAAMTSLVRNLNARFDAAMAEAEAINLQQALLDQAVADYHTDLQELKARMAPFEKLWTLAAQYVVNTQKWYDAPLLSNNADEAGRDADNQRLATIKLLREVPEEATAPRTLLTKIRDDYDHFIATDQALLALLANPGLKERHWTAMEASVGFDLPHDESSCLADMLDLKLDEHIDKIEEHCVNASKEFSLERALDRMEAEWQPVKLDLKSHGGSGTHILTGASSEEVQALLDDHIVKSMTMAASRFAKPLEARIKAWVAGLTEIQSVLDVWLKVQSQWLYLAPIFSSEDIMHQMPVEGQRFQQVDGTWRQLMVGAVADPQALNALRQPGMLAALKDSHGLLEQIQKGLNDYLEQKRLVFPRFFFLSNDELLEILAETKDPTRVQPHLRKCFEGIDRLEFAGNGEILAMISAEGEKVKFVPSPQTGRLINPADARGNVEQWLLQVEGAMKRACATVIDEACHSYATAASRPEWTQKWPAQAVLGVTQTYWTQDVEHALRSGGGPAALRDYAAKCTKQIEDVIMLVRGNLPKLLRTTLGALVVLDVHARDVVEKMADVGVSRVIDFDWNSQLRYYWTDDGKSAATGKPGSLTMRMINAALKYGYEYLGNTTRLVITPLTDRCYRTLMGALHLNLGGAPEGPAGTGKTETVKDLSKAAAFQCVVFNCSDGLDYLAMAKFFKGLAASGAWACFDEFNRIELEVLSVIAQQVLTIQQAVRERREIFTFEGTELRLNPTCSSFITMNPGYAGRSELPDNLKSLFRSVAMMVPDYRLISEIVLFSNGYMDARPLAAKIVATYKLSSEQLSSQDHYDYGMRAVMAVLRAAGDQKRTAGHLPEDVLVLRSIIDVNLPKFLQPDVPLFNSIVRDLFPGVTVPPPDVETLVDAMKSAAFDLGVQAVPPLIEKALQAEAMSRIRHGWMIVGQPFSGKTTVQRVIQGAMQKLHEADPSDPRWAVIHRVVINPKSISSGALYGKFDDLTHEWTDGILAKKFRDCALNRIAPDCEKDRKWLVFDGPVDAVWIENLNTVLDDNKKLCLTSGEIIVMSAVMSMVFEVADLAAASPATVSRCGMIYTEPSSLGWRPLVASWLEHRAQDNPRFPFKAARPSDAIAMARQEREERAAYEAANDASAADDGKKRRKAVLVHDPRTWTIDAATAAQLHALFELYVDPCLVILRRQHLSEYCPTQDSMLLASLIGILDSVLTQLIDAASSEDSRSEGGYRVGHKVCSGKPELSVTDVEGAFLFALTWSIGGTVNEAGRAVLTEFLSQAVRDATFLAKHPLQPYFAARGWKTPGAGTPLASAATVYDRPTAAVSVPPPQGSLLHDSFYVPSENRWMGWTSVLDKADIPATAQYADIIVPTAASTQFEYLVQLLLSHKRSVAVCGPTGVGKSAYMRRMLLDTLPREAWLPVLVSLSARTSAASTQAMVDVKLTKRRRGVYGPPPGQTCVVFVDDLNLPEPEKWGAMPPLELLRQLNDQGGWYDLVENEFMNIEDVVMATAMGPPGGGRSFVPPRLLRHFNLLCFTEMNDATLTQIFGTVMDWYFAKSSFSGDVSRLAPAVVQSTLNLYKRAIEGLRPTPMKSHYTFNLRDFSRVIEGVFLSSPANVHDAPAFTRLWIHEATRVFCDRLTDDSDRAWLLDQLKDLTQKFFGQDLDALCQFLVTGASGAPAAAASSSSSQPVTVEHLRSLLWIDYGDTGTAASKSASPVPGISVDVTAVPKGYAEASILPVMASRLEACLADFNSQTKQPMDLVVFLFFMEHVTRVSRVLKMPGGHALLVGVGGSGRRCATRLAAFIADMQVMEVELSKSYGNTEWREDLKRILREAGTGARPVVFNFADTSIKWEGMLEDINAILNSGEVPGLFAADERADICEKVAPLAKAAGARRDITPAELFAYFVTRVKRNLHIVLCMSWVGDAFRDRLRRFPSLVNCCTIDWYTPWPKDALSAVATKTLKGMGLDDTVLGQVVDACQFFHRSARSLSTDFASQLRRHNYVTPTSYLELLTTFRRYMDSKRKDVSAARLRYVTGLEKLEFATLQVNEMQRELNALQPSLKKSQEETAELMRVIESRLPGVQETRGIVSKEAAAANVEAEAVGKVKQECADDLAVAMPVLESAMKSLDTISPSDITLVKSMANPPANVKMVMAAVCVMLGEKPDRVADPTNPMKKVEDYWPASKRLLGQSTFLARLKGYDINNIDARIIAAIRKDYIPLENFKPEIVSSSSSAAEGLCRWIIALDQYERVVKVVAPKQAALAEAEAKLEATMAELNAKKAKLQAVEDELAELQKQLDAANRTQEDLAKQVDLCSKKLMRAEQLLRGLGGEKLRWQASADELAAQLVNLTGDVLLSSGMIAYLGAFTADFRRRATSSWLSKCLELSIACSASAPAAPAVGDDVDGGAVAAVVRQNFSLPTVLGDPILIRRWQIDGLPTDSYSTESAIICTLSRRWPLAIDPQGQANKWIRNTEKASGLIVVKLSDTNFLRTLENAIQFGRPVLLENVGEELDPTLEPVLLKVVFKQGGVNCIRLGDATIEYDERFKLYITTKLPNPHYLPEVSTKVTLCNFLITPDGLCDQLLGITVAQERPDLQEQKNRLIVQGAENQRALKEVENRILHVLSSSEGNILEDETAITVLNTSKALANDIGEKQRIAAKTEQAIDTARAGYTPVAQHASRLFFCIASLGGIEPMYQYSMDWFVRLFIASIQGSAKADDLGTRISNLNGHFTYSMYRNVCRSLFEKDKTLFAFLLTVTIMLGKGEVDIAEFYFLLTGGVGAETTEPNPAPEWLADKAWVQLAKLSELTAFDGLHTDIAAAPAGWKKLFDSDTPQRETLPGRWGTMGALTRLQKLLVLRCVRPDRLVMGMQEFVAAQLGAKFTQPPPFDLKACYEDSSPGQPLVFVLSPGSDPMAALMYFAESQKVKVFAISLGQGQGPIAESMIERARKEGGWVVLQNCHLAVSWMPRLESICEQLAADADAAAGGATAASATPISPTFRLWLTSYPSPSFPVSVLQNGVKMTNEPPHGLRENIKRSFLTEPISDPSFFDGVTTNAPQFRKLLYGLCFFHALVQERRFFGSLGFNIPYQFTEADLRISARQLAMFVQDAELTGASAAGGAAAAAADAAAEATIPWKHLRYLTAECNYGGRVTDDMDRRCLNAILDIFYSPNMLVPAAPLCSSKEFSVPGDDVSEYAQFLSYVDSLPGHASCSVFGLHENAAIARDLQQTTELLDAALLTAATIAAVAPAAEGAQDSDAEAGAAGAASGGATSAATSTPAAAPAAGGHEKKAKTRDETIAEVANDIVSRLPPDFDLEGVELKYPTDPKEAMNTVLLMELARYNRLLGVIRTSMKDVQKAMKGLIVMSSALETVASELFTNRVPGLWRGRSYPTRKPLAAYFADLLKRLHFLQAWVDHGKPPAFWLPGFFFTQSFLTGVTQNFARAYNIPIDQLTFDVRMLAATTASVIAGPAPADGAHVHGLYLDGCKWDAGKSVLGESEPGVLYAPAPAMWFLPVKASELRAFPHYVAPLYRTTERRGVLSTTGHSTNHVTNVRMPSDKPAEHWICRGVAMVLALDD